jgi:hypothetical protein
MYGDQLDACYGVALVFLLISTYKALKQMKKLAAKQTGVKTIMILFCVLFLMRICSTVTMHIFKNHINNIYTSKNIFFEVGTAICWTLFDVVPLAMIFSIQRINFASFDTEDERLLCELSCDDDDTDFSTFDEF